MLPLAMIILARNAQILACDDLSLLRSLPHETKLVHSDPHHVFVVGAHSDFEVPRSDLREAEILPSPVPTAALVPRQERDEIDDAKSWPARWRIDLK